MKGFLLILAMLFLAAVPSLAGEDRDMLYREQAAKDLQDLDFSCPDDFSQASPAALSESLENAGKTSKRTDIDTACRMKALLKRDHAYKSDVFLLHTYNFLVTSPALAAYFLTAMESERPGSETDMLAGLYADGHGVMQDEERAARMYRAYLTRFLPGAFKPAECQSDIAKKRRSENHPLYESQIEWVMSQCAQSPENLFLMAKEYAASPDPYEQEIAGNIRSYILRTEDSRPLLREIEEKLPAP